MIEVRRGNGGIATDTDGLSDALELAIGTDPLLATSYPGDGDINQDGSLNTADVLVLTQMALGL